MDPDTNGTSSPPTTRPALGTPAPPSTPAQPPPAATTPTQIPSPPPSESSSATARPGTALTTLAELRVAGRGPKTGYSREQFGRAWIDIDRNGCDTRNDILTRDLTDRRYRSPASCAVVTGSLDDPYTATTIRFVRGGPSEVDIDHVVSLGNAWVTGASRLSSAQRVAFANDPLNLLAVDATANRQKGDGDAATWLPPNRAFRCAFIARQIGVKDKYGLYVTPPEKEAMTRVLATCPGQSVISG